METNCRRKPTMTLAEVVAAMRAAGFRTTEPAVAMAIDTGRYPFGTVIGTGSTGRRHFEILRVDFERWLSEVTQ